MPDRSDLAVRMKENYEKIPRHYLMKRTPVAIRLDGKAFHTFTRGFERPYDKVLGDTMVQTMKYLCENIQGCVFGYTQSDEITLILIDYQTLDTDAWFDYEVQKICSIAASMATLAFNKYFDKETDEWFSANAGGDYSYEDALIKACQKGATFDARCFNIPREEVANLIYWRQLDAKRNSVQMCGQAVFSQNELQEKTCEDIKIMLSYNWEDLPATKKWGTACWKSVTGWIIDRNMPLIKGEGREYVEQFI